MEKRAEDIVSRIARVIKADMDDATGAGGDEPVEHDIDITCYYDTYMGRSDFDDNFIRLTHQKSDLYAYGFDPNDYDTKDIFKITDYDELADEFGSEYDFHEYIDDIDPYDLAEIIINEVPVEQLSSLLLEDFEGKNDLGDWIEERSEKEEGEGKYGWLLDLLPDSLVKMIEEEAKLHVDYPSLNDMWEAVADGRGGIELKDGWSCFTSTGYSKGDYCTVFGKSEDIDNWWTKTLIEHMLWDSPICCRIYVDGEEFYVDSEMDDRYRYDKNEVIRIMKSLMGNNWDDQIEEYLEDNLPDQPEYSY